MKNYQDKLKQRTLQYGPLSSYEEVDHVDKEISKCSFIKMQSV